MRASEFYEHFERAFVVSSPPATLRRLAGKQLKWKSEAPEGSITLGFSTNSRAAGLLPLLWPGEFRPTFRWAHGGPAGKVVDDVSFFQYADRSGVQEAVRLQRSAIGKYLSLRFASAEERDQWVNTYDPFSEPRPSVERWLYYFDAEDAAAWGKYFGSAAAGWMRDFSERPESMDAW